MHTIAALLLLGALVFLGYVWWVNGRDDTWMYVTSAMIVLSSFMYLSPFKKDKNQ